MKTTLLLLALAATAQSAPAQTAPAQTAPAQTAPVPTSAARFAPVQDDERVADLVARGRQHLDAGEHELALELFLQADGAARGSLGTRMWILRTWFAQGRINDAFDRVDELAADHDGADVAYLYGMGSFLKAVGYLAQGVPPNTTGLAFQDAQRFLAAALDADPEKYYDAWYPLAESAWRNQDLATAQKAVGRALANAPEDARAYLLSGRIAFSSFVTKNADESQRAEAQRDLALAIASLERAASFAQPTQSNAALLGNIYRELGIALQWNEQNDEAVQSYANALGWNPTVLDFGSFWSSLGPERFLTMAELGAKLSEERSGPDSVADATLLWWLGFAYHTAAQHEETEATFERVLAKWPECFNSWFYIGMSRYHRAAYDEAIAAWKENWRSDPADLVASVQTDRELHLAVLEYLVQWCAKKAGPRPDDAPPGTPPGEVAYNVDAAFLCEILCGVFPEHWKNWNDLGYFTRDAGKYIAGRGEDGDDEKAQKLYERAFDVYSIAIERFPEKPHFYNDAAAILHYDLDRDLGRAREMYETALRMATAQLASARLTPEDRVYVENARDDARKNLEALDGK